MASPKESYLFYDSEITLSSSKGTSNPKPQETFSVFGEEACGEPLNAQHIVIDFTPDENIDNDFVQKKICMFWKFINNTPEIKNLRVLPETTSYTKVATPTPSVSSKSTITVEPEPVVERRGTAVSVLNFMHEKDKELVKHVFGAKMPIYYCSLGPREYNEQEPVKSQSSKKPNLKPCLCPRIEPVKLSPTTQLCMELKQWGNLHPKSMEGPGHPPSFCHAILQRSVYQ